MLNADQVMTRFDQRFPNESSCRNQLAYLKWGRNHEGFRCPVPECQSRKHQKTPTKNGLFRCKKCDFRVSVRQGTIFEDSKLPLRDWLRAMWVMSYQKWGINASELKKILGRNAYCVAFGMLRKIRYAMSPNQWIRLESSSFQVCARSIKSIPKDSVVLVIVEEGIQGRLIRPRRVRLKTIDLKNHSEVNLTISRYVAKGAYVWADGSIPKPALGHQHQIRTVNPIRKGKRSEVHLANEVVEELGNWLKQKYRGHVQKDYLQQYLDEFAFWWNTRVELTGDPNEWSWETAEETFEILLNQAVRTKPAPKRTSKAKGPSTRGSANPS